MTHSQRKKLARRRNHSNMDLRLAYDRNEPRLMLASDFIGPMIFTPADISDIYSKDAVTYEQMETRALYYRYMPNEVVVAVSVNTSKSQTVAAVNDVPWKQWTGHGAAALRRVLQVVERGASTVAVVHVDLGSRANVLAAMRFLNDRDGVLWSAPNFFHSGPDPRDYIPNDPLYGNQYHHNNMNNPSAWDVSLGNPNIVIGVTDDGVLLTHPDLQPNIWVNPGEIPGNGIDDDNNGYIDDVNGWDFSSGNNNPNPNGNNDHGTHVAGIAAARTDNGVGIAGVAGLATIMPLQFYAGISPWTAAIINETYTYSADNGAHIVTTSYNVDGWVGDPTFTAGLQYMYDAGVLHFNSAGNNNQLNPARQVFEQSLFVSSLDQNNVKSSFSNYGTGIDIAGHGTSIYATVLNNNYGTKSGTSMSTPNVAGAAALLWGVHPQWNRYQVAAHLLATTTNIDAQNPNFVGLLGAGMVNTGAALNTSSIPAPRVKSLTGLPAAGSTTDNFNVTGFTVAFNQVMDPVTVNNASSFVLRESGLDGVFGTADDRIIDMTANKPYRVGTNLLTFAFAGGSLGPGNYQLTLVSGGLTNPFGTPLDGNGDGIGGDSLNYTFKLEPQTVQVLPAGSQVYEQKFPGAVHQPQSTFDYYLEVDAGQTLAVGVRGSGGLIPTIQIRNPSDQVLANVTGTGASAVTQPVSVLTPGRYTIRIGGASNTTGSFQTHVILNSGLELSEFGGALNNSLATAQNIESSSIAIGNQADRLALRGSLAPTSLYYEGFETGTLGSAWTTSVSNAAGRIRLIGQHGTAAGNFAMLMDVGSNNVYSRNEATWTVNLAGATSATLSFYHASWNDEVHTMPTSFTSSSNSDGVAISANGTNWFRVYTPTGSMPVGQWQQQSVDLVAAAAAAGISLGNNFRIRFQQYDNYPIDTDGRGFDEIRITGSTAGSSGDWYAFTLADGEYASVAATSTSGPNVAVELYNASGNLLASGSSKNNVNSFIDRFQDGTSNQVRDTYYVRVSGGTSDYSLVVTRNSQFDAESNDTQGTAQLLDGLSGVVGFATTTSDFFRLPATTGQTIAWDAHLPGQGPYLINNGLDQANGSQLRLQLIAPGGGVVASGISSIEHTAATTGNYFIRAWANSGSGEYVLVKRPTQVSISIETGIVTAPADVPVTVNLSQTFNDPVIILGPPATTSSEPMIANVFNVSSNSFQLRLTSWNLDTDPNFTETVRYLVVERGVTKAGGDKQLVVDPSKFLDTFTTVGFPTPFQWVAAVVATPIRDASVHPKTVRMHSVGAAGFQGRTQFAEALDGSADDILTVNYVAIDPGRYELNGWILETGMTPNAVTHQPYTINYQQPLPAVPFFGAQIMTFNEADPAAIRQTSNTTTSATIFLQEETTLDSEISHQAEVVGYLALAPVGGFQAPESQIGEGEWETSSRSIVDGRVVVFSPAEPQAAASHIQSAQQIAWDQSPDNSLVVAPASSMATSANQTGDGSTTVRSGWRTVRISMDLTSRFKEALHDEVFSDLNDSLSVA